MNILVYLKKDILLSSALSNSILILVLNDFFW